MVAMFVNESKRMSNLKRFQRRRLKCKKLTDDRCQVMAKAHIAFGQIELIKNGRH